MLTLLSGFVGIFDRFFFIGTSGTSTQLVIARPYRVLQYTVHACEDFDRGFRERQFRRRY